MKTQLALINQKNKGTKSCTIIITSKTTIKKTPPNNQPF